MFISEFNLFYVFNVLHKQKFYQCCDNHQQLVTVYSACRALSTRFSVTFKTRFTFTFGTFSTAVLNTNGVFIAMNQPIRAGHVSLTRNSQFAIHRPHQLVSAVSTQALSGVSSSAEIAYSFASTESPFAVRCTFMSFKFFELDAAY